jgi:hypothetical protein
MRKDPIEEAALKVLEASSPKYGYVALYNGQRWEVYASSIWAAKQAAAAHFKLPINGTKIQRLAVVLAEKDGKPVIQSGASL